MSEFESERQNKNTNKIKESKYLKQKNQMQSVVRLNFQYLCLNHLLNNINVKLDDVIHGNDISTNGVVVMYNFNK